MMKRKQILLVLIFIISLAMVAFFDMRPVVSHPKPAEGYLDLSAWSFEENGVVPLEGEWAFYYNAFLTSDDFKGENLPEARYINIPSNQSNIKASKPFDSNKFYGTMRLVVDLPTNNQIYGLKTDIVLSAYKLYANGIYMGGIGGVGSDAESASPYYGILESYFSPIDNRVELIYHASDFSFEDCAITGPTIGLGHQITSASKLSAGKDLFLFGMLLTMGLYHIGLYWIRKKDRGPLYFGLFCIMFAVRMLLIGSRVLPMLLSMSFIIYARLAYITVFIGVFSLFAYLYHTFNELFPKRFVQMGFYMALISVAIGLFAPFNWIDNWILVYALVNFSLMGYAILRLIVGIKRNVLFAGWVLFGFVCILMTFLNDFVYEVTLSNKGSLIPLGMALFIMLQAYTLSAKFSNAFSNVEKLSAENELMLSEVKHVNANLESIVENRTRDLKEALVEMDLMSKTDYLTKLPNRRLMFQKIDELIQNKQDFFVAIADIDKFKIVNDTYGHDKGDVILQDLSERLKLTLGDDGFVGRWGGEEFLIILYGSNEYKALTLSNKIRESIGSKYNVVIKSPITITVGLCQYDGSTTIDAVIANADKALYEGKLGGRNQCRLYRM